MPEAPRSPEDFPHVKIEPVTVRATIKYEVTMGDAGDVADAKRDFEDAINTLRYRGEANVTWEEPAT